MRNFEINIIFKFTKFFIYCFLNYIMQFSELFPIIFWHYIGSDEGKGGCLSLR